MQHATAAMAKGKQPGDEAAAETDSENNAANDGELALPDAVQTREQSTQE